MKVSQDFRITQEPIRNGQKIQNQESVSFQRTMQNHVGKIQTEQLQQMLAAMEQAGERLAKSRNFRDLVKYKNLIQNYLKDAVSLGMELKNTHTWNESGQNRLLKRIEIINEKLIELTEEIFRKEEENIRILALLGEIKGLLINLYT